MTPSAGVILYGPPASGKDTITKALADLDSRYAHYPRMKMGDGRTEGYRFIDSMELASLRKADRVIWENERYDATYVIERNSLIDLASTSVPVVHLGQISAVSAVHGSMPHLHWIDAYLWCPRNVAEQRLRQRESGDLTARLRAWDETAPLPNGLMLNTATISASDAASAIHHQVVQSGMSVTAVTSVTPQVRGSRQGYS